MSGDERDKIRTHVKKIGEEAKVAIRNIRKQAKKSLKDLPENERIPAESKLQEKTDLSVSIIAEGVTEKVSQL